MNLRVDRVLFAAAIYAGLMAGNASAQPSGKTAPADYPTKPIRFVIPFPPGGFSEVIGRMIGEKLSASVGQAVVSDIRPGASGNIGADIVAKAAPDGYTLLINSFNFVGNPSAMRLPFDPVKDFVPVSLVADDMPVVFVVNRAAPFKSMHDLIAAARARPGQLNFATSGTGTSSHLTAEMLKTLAGIDVVLVPYKGTLQSLTPLMAGDITLSMPYLSTVLSHLRNGQVRGLATTGTRRSASVPELPTMLELGFTGFKLTGFVGLLAPARTPRAIVARLNREMVAISKQHEFAERLALYDMHPVGSTPEAFAKYMKQEIARWTKVLSLAGYKLQ